MVLGLEFESSKLQSGPPYSGRITLRMLTSAKCQKRTLNGLEIAFLRQVRISERAAALLNVPALECTETY